MSIPKIGYCVLLLGFLSSIAANVRISHCSSMTVTYADRRVIELDIVVDLKKVGIVDGNNTRLLMLSAAWIGDYVSGGWTNVNLSEIRGTSGLVKTKDEIAAYTFGESFGSVGFFTGVEFYVENIPPYEANSTISFHVGLGVRDNYGLFLRLNRQYPDYYPFDALTFGLTALVFSKDSSNASATFDFSEDFFTSSGIPFKPISRSVDFRLEEWGYLFSSEGQVENNVATQYVTDDIVLVRNDFERTFIPMLLIISFLLLVVVALLTWKARLDGVVAVFLSLVVLDIGIFEKLRQVNWRTWGPNMLVVLDLFSATSLILVAALLASKRTLYSANKLARKELATKPLIVKGIFVEILVAIPIVLRLFSGSLLCNEFWYFSFALREIYISVGTFILLIPVATCLFFVIGRTLYDRRRSFEAAIKRLRKLFNSRRVFWRREHVQKAEEHGG